MAGLLLKHETINEPQKAVCAHSLKEKHVLLDIKSIGEIQSSKLKALQSFFRQNFNSPNVDSRYLTAKKYYP